MPKLYFNRGSGFTLIPKDLADSSFLMHYRVGGEKKGVRRWQNKDGSFTPEGYQHYKEMYGWGDRIKGSVDRDIKTPKNTKRLTNYSGHAYFISETSDLTKLDPRVPSNFFTKNGYEDSTTPRVCFAPSIDKCLAGLSQNLSGKTYTVYELKDPDKHAVFQPNTKAVPDADITNELWVCDSVELLKKGTVTVTGSRNEAGKKFAYGDHEAELYDDWTYEFKESGNPTSDDSKQRMSVRNDRDREGDPAYTKAVLAHVDIPVEKLSKISRLSRDSDIRQVRHDINHPADETDINIPTKEYGDQLLSDTGRHYNCPNCACAFEMTERGYDVTARRATDGSNVGDIARFFKGGHLENAELKYDVKSLVPPGPASAKDWQKKYIKYTEGLLEARKEAVVNFYQQLDKQGVGARGIIVVGWLMDQDFNNRTTAFHALNYKVEDRGVVFYDAQSSRRYDGFQNNGYFMGCDPRELHFMRTDLLDLDESITQTVYSKGRGSK